MDQRKINAYNDAAFKLDEVGEHQLARIIMALKQEHIELQKTTDNIQAVVDKLTAAGII